MWELDYREGWALKNWCFQIVVLEMTLESPLDCKEIKQVNPKGKEPWIVIGRTDAEAETPLLWPMKNQFTGKYHDAGKDWKQKEEGAAEDEMFREHHRLNGHEFEWIPKDSERQGCLVCYSPWDHKEWSLKWLNNNPLTLSSFEVGTWRFYLCHSFLYSLLLVSHLTFKEHLTNKYKQILINEKTAS